MDCLDGSNVIIREGQSPREVIVQRRQCDNGSREILKVIYCWL